MNNTLEIYISLFRKAVIKQAVVSKNDYSFTTSKARYTILKVDEVTRLDVKPIDSDGYAIGCSTMIHNSKVMDHDFRTVVLKLKRILS